MNFLTRYFRRRLAFSTYDPVQAANTRGALQQAGVPFKLRQHTDDITGPPLAGGSAVPFHMQAGTEYLFYVDRADLELAEYLAGGGSLD